MDKSKYEDGLYRVTFADGDYRVFDIADDKIRFSATPLDYYDKNGNKIEKIQLMPESLRVHIVLAHGPYSDSSYIAGVYFDRGNAFSHVNDLERKNGRGTATLVSERVQTEYQWPAKPKVSTYEVKARIDAWTNAWEANFFPLDDKIGGFNILSPIDRGTYRVYVRATSVDDAIAQGKAIFVKHITA